MECNARCQGRNSGLLKEQLASSTAPGERLLVFQYYREVLRKIDWTKLQHGPSMGPFVEVQAELFGPSLTMDHNGLGVARPNYVVEDEQGTEFEAEGLTEENDDNLLLISHGLVLNTNRKTDSKVCLANV